MSCVSASKTWNIPGLKCAQLVASQSVIEGLKEAIPIEATYGVGHFGVVATLAAYRDGGPWWAEMLGVLDARRTQLFEGLSSFEGVHMTWPQASYLAWVHLPMLGDDPAAVLLEEGSLAINAGLTFGSVGQAHARINFATSEAILEEIITRVGSIVDAHSS